MSRSPNTPAAHDPHVPAALVSQHRADWHEFTRYVVITCAAVAGVLLLMLLFLRIL